MSNLLTARTGSEQHTSTWAKFRVEGIEMVAEGRANIRQNQNYHDYALESPPDGVVFSVWMSSGNRRGADTMRFLLCVTDQEAPEIEVDDGYCFVRGCFRIIADADTLTKAKRLLGWWVDWAPKHGGQSEKTAKLLAEQIDIRGRKDPRSE